MIRQNSKNEQFGGRPGLLVKQNSQHHDILKRAGSRENLTKQASTRRLGLTTQGSDLGLNRGMREVTDALMIGDMDETEAHTESTGADDGHTPTSASLPESISWKVTRSWDLVKDKSEKVGVDFFLRLFDEHPQAADLFKFGASLSYKDHEQVPRGLRIHAKKVMDAVGLCVGGLTHLPDLIPTLRSLGHFHQSLGVQDFHYDVVYGHLMDAIEAEVGPKAFDKQTREAWAIVYQSLTNVMKHPSTVLQIEPLEGWGVANTLACAFLVIFTPFQMAGFVAWNSWTNWLLSVLTFVAAFGIIAFDMASHWIADKVRPSASSESLLLHSRLRRKIELAIFPVKFRVIRFLRSLQMNKWAKWDRMEFIILASFPLQHCATMFSLNSAPEAVGVHWTYIFGLMRLTAISRVVHSLTCAENNVLLRRRQINPQQLLAMRMVKLIITMFIVIHVNACLWCIVARIELGPETVKAVPSAFFPKAAIFEDSFSPLNAYLHAVHWAWVSLAGIGDTDSNPETSLEHCVVLAVHICGATLLTITTGNVVAILEAITEKQNESGNDLAELGHFMGECNVPQDIQKRMMDGYMMQALLESQGALSSVKRSKVTSRAPETPDAVSRLPGHLRTEMATYLRIEAIRRRDRGFVHCSHEFLVAFVGSLKTRMTLLCDDDYVLQGGAMPCQVALIVDGCLEVISSDERVKTLHVGDVVGKKWLLGSKNHAANVGFRAAGVCTLITGLSSKKQIELLFDRFSRDFGLLKANQSFS